MDTMIISCFYNKHQCNSSSFTWFRDHEFGNCYTFNDLISSQNISTDSLSTNKAGPNNGLVLELYVGASGSQDYYTIKKGIKIAVHERGVRPLLKYQGIIVGTGTAAEVGITRTNYSKLDKPYSDCRKDTDTILQKDSLFFKYTLGISKYSQKLCYEICMQYVQIIPNCGCADPSIPIVDTNQTICSNSSSLSCVKNQTDLFDGLVIDDICGSYCPLECDSVVYSTSVSSAIYPTTYYSNIISSQSNLISKFKMQNSFSPPTVSFSTGSSINGNPGSPAVGRKKRSDLVNSNSTNTNSSSNAGTSNSTNTTSSNNKPNGAEIEKAVVMISIYYEDLRYTFIQETAAITFDTLIGVIGGQFGLFMGASFLSFVEIFEMIVNLIRVTIKYKKAKNMVKLFR